MRLDGRYVAVIDRFEDDRGVLLVEREGEVVEELVVDRAVLPADARHQNAVLEITLDSGVLRNLEYLPDETDQRSTEAQDRFDRLSRRPPGSDDRSDAPDSADSGANGDPGANGDSAEDAVSAEDGDSGENANSTGDADSAGNADSTEDTC